MEDDKADMLCAGLRLHMLKEYPGASREEITSMSFGYLSSLCTQMMSSYEASRERARLSFNRLVGVVRRTRTLFAVRCLEMELHDRTEALRHVTPDQLAGLCRSRRQTQRELLAARQRYISMLRPGDCPTWRVA